MMAKTPRRERVAEVVCSVLGGSTPDHITAGHRGSPRTADLRAVCWHVWRSLHKSDTPTLTAIAQVWGRDRRNVARGLHRIKQKGLPSTTHMMEIMRQLRVN